MLNTMFEAIKKLYYASEYKNIVFEVFDVCFLLDDNWKKIAISSSGGMDSTLLLYILCNEIKKRNLNIEVHVIHNIRLWKTRPWQKYTSINVLEYFKDKFKNINFIRHENFIPPEIEWGSTGPTIYDEYGKLKSGNQIELRAHAEYICFTHSINAWFCGVTKNPEIINGGLEDRNIKSIENIDFVKFVRPHMGVIACHPFTHVEKDWIAGRYKEFKIQDLLLLTRSCEGDNLQYPEIFQGLDYKNYNTDITVPICNQCFWCKEREWGILNAK
jgi:hypothetical protein